MYKPTLVLPASYLDEIKSLPEHKISFAVDFNDRHYGQMMLPDVDVIKSIKIDLTQNIVRTLKVLQDECEYAFSNTMPGCPSTTWTPVHVYPIVTRMVALLSGRVFVGLPLCRSEKWISLTINSTIESFQGVTKLDQYSNFWRPCARLFIPEVKNLSRNIERAKEMLKPILEQRLEDMKAEDFKSPNDLMDVSI